ncbi:MAG: chloride channel protein [Bacteroidales bacterium]|nr:chloride channel protein [Bacteroidales bacterium]
MDIKKQRKYRLFRTLSRFNEWRIQHISTSQYMIILSILAGLIASVVAWVLRSLTHSISGTLEALSDAAQMEWLSFVYPIVGILVTMFFVNYILRHNVSGGIPRVLYSISKEGAVIKSHNMFSSVISSALTVGFGGSAGLEGPTVVTGAAIGSNIGRLLHLNYKQKLLILGCATAAALSAMFKAPITGTVFVLEVFMLDLTMASLAPLLVSSVTGVLVSYMLMGANPLYFFRAGGSLEASDVPVYFLLGVVSAVSSIYFTKSYIWVSNKFKKVKTLWGRFAVGCVCLAVLIYLFPALYGEGVSTINNCINSECNFLFTNGFYTSAKSNMWLVALLIFIVLLMKPIATSLTFAAGGVGGIFMPSLFVGACTGQLTALVLSLCGVNGINAANMALVGMAGTIGGVLHAPLTAVFLIAEITGGYKLFVPLLLVSVISYVVTRRFINNSIYTFQLAQRNELMTHHVDKKVINFMKLDNLIERNFAVVYPGDSLRVLVKAVEETSRNIFAVVDRDDNTFLGIIKLDNIRNIMFKPEYYDKVFVRDLVFRPDYTVRIDESMESVVTKFSHSDKFNIAVLDQNNKYLGFVSRARIFSIYRRMSRQLSEE